jgi:nitroimidazol reductase NimA-like FMN-containing flavoprotein (pyridoxamine 5'-phosphate oxidase superfamily)
LDEIDESECWRLLTTQLVGRVAVVDGRYPLVFPVNYAVEGKQIVFRTGAGVKLRAISRSNVAFQVDAVDVVHRSGWSVMACGAAQEVDETMSPNLAALCESGSAAPWAPGHRERTVRIVADRITGRRIRPADMAPASDQRGYL